MSLRILSSTLSLALASALGLGFATAGCGGPPKQAKSADDEISTATDNSGPTSDMPAPGTADDSTAKTSAGSKGCTGFEMDLMAALNQSACEVQNVKPDEKGKDTKDTLSVTATADSARVAPGGHADILVTFANKSTNPLTLDFTIDPTPRFDVETSSVKTNKRIDPPPSDPPKPPADAPAKESVTPSTARITLAANGKATVHVGWDAVRTRWAPEKYKGTPLEMGYPRAPAGPLPKGKYSIRVDTPLTNIFEGVDKEVSGPHTVIEVQ
jgi:hypothetical protein